MTQKDIFAILPTIIVAGWGVILLVADLWIPRERKGIVAALAVFGLAAAMGVALTMGGKADTAFGGMVVVDGFSNYLTILFLASGIAGIAIAHDYLKRMQIIRGEYYVLMLFSVAGMMMMAQANNLLMFFLSLEMLSIPLYILTGFAHPKIESEEASLKYFLMGAFASGFVLYGSAMIFGATAQLGFPEIIASIKSGTANMVLLPIGAALLLVGFGFKVAAVPFHKWTPDVYQGAPSPVTGFMSVAVKAAGFAALLRIFIVIFPVISESLTPVFWVIAALTMITGNLIAVAQKNVKRMLAYSSIAHAGYILTAFVAFGNNVVVNDMVAATLFYLLAYGLTSFGAWSVLVLVEKEYAQGLELEDFSGLGTKYPWLGASMLVFMMSFAGIPLTMGFWGKFYLFRTAVGAGYSSLVLIGLITSIFSAFYYLRVVVFMFMKPGEPTVRRNFWVSLVIVGCALAVVLLSVVPDPIINLATSAMMLLQ
ncbi:MAG: NADH-quinone oxidoreductase subunit N [Anaerolineaceae bacterium]